VCYDDLGCFGKNQGPMKHLSELPSKPEDINTQREECNFCSCFPGFVRDSRKMCIKKEECPRLDG